MGLLIQAKALTTVRAGNSYERQWFSVHGQKNPVGISVCLYNEHEKCDVLKAAAYDFTKGNEYGYNPMWAATYGGHTSMVQRLIECKCDVTGADIKKEVGCHDALSTYATANNVYNRLDAKGWTLNWVAVCTPRQWTCSKYS